jgi:hypothetical protein
MNFSSNQPIINVLFLIILGSALCIALGTTWEVYNRKKQGRQYNWQMLLTDLSLPLGMVILVLHESHAGGMLRLSQPISIIASNARLATAGSEWKTACVRATGVICQAAFIRYPLFLLLRVMKGLGECG